MPGATSTKTSRGTSTRGPSSFAERVTMFSDRVEDAHDIEREYLLGASAKTIRPSTGRLYGGAGTKVAETGTSRLDYKHLDSVEDLPISETTSMKVMKYSNYLMMAFGLALVAVCIAESHDSRNADEHCPLLYIGGVIGGIIVFVSFLGLFGIMNCCSKSERHAVLYCYHTGSLLSLVLLIMLSIATLIHWDVGGAPSNDLWHAKESVGVKHRYLIWGVALGAALSVCASILGTLNSEWSTGNSIYKWTTVSCAFFMLTAGVLMSILFYWIYDSNEFHKLAHPVWVIGSVVGGALTIIAAFYGLFFLREGEHLADMIPKLSRFMGFTVVAAAVVLLVSIGNAITAEPEKASDRRTYTLLSGLIGVWSQLISCVALTAASRWRHSYQANILVTAESKV